MPKNNSVISPHHYIMFCFLLLFFHPSRIIEIKVVKLATIVEGDPKAPFQQLQHQGVGEGATPFPELLHLTLDTYHIMLSVKQGDIKYHFFESLV